jgi:crotonobetainyl-CoA:carnitine CoA-transferase CaiB-like acyl-CoA transferase
VTDGAAPPTGADRPNFLRGLRVLELGDAPSGASATSQLRALGAEVVAAVDPTSWHRRARPSVGADGGSSSLVSLALDRAKSLVTLAGLDDLEALLDPAGSGGAPFDLVVVDRIGGLGGALAGLSDLERYTAFVDAHPGVAWLTVSAFGLTGPRAGEVATELTLAAASGVLNAVRMADSGRPIKFGGLQSLLVTGQAVALAACQAIDLASSASAAGRPVHLDLSAFEAVVALGPVLELGGYLLETGVAGGGAGRYGAPSGFYQCIDGLIRISAMEDHQWRGVVTAMGSPEWTTRFDTVESRIDGAAEVNAHIDEWSRGLHQTEAETLLQANGVPATALYAPAEILDSPQLAHRGAFEDLPLGDGRHATVVGLPFRLIGSPDQGSGAGSEGSARRRSIRGLRVLEAGHVLAVPMAGAVLGALGARVTKLEDVARIDMYRRRGPYIAGQAGPERSAYFALANHSKDSVSFDVTSRPDDLEALLADADVVIENLGGRRATAIGVAAASVAASRPDVLAVSSSGFGQDGPLAHYRAYAYNLQASSGLGYLTRDEQGEHPAIDVAWADLLSAYALATVVAAWAVGPAGNGGAGIDFAMSDLIVAHFNEFLAAASLDPSDESGFDRANQVSPFVPCGAYPSADGWIALAVDGDEQFDALVAVLGDDALRALGEGGRAGREERRAALDARIAGSTATRSAAELGGALRAVGVAAEPVAPAAELLTDPQLEARGFFVDVEHDEWGRRRLVGLPWRPYGERAHPLGAPPQLVPLPDRDDLRDDRRDDTRV